MKELLMLLAAQMPKEMILDKLIESCDECREAELIDNEEKIEDARHHLFLSCNLYIMNYITKGDAKTAMDQITKMGEIEKAHRFFQTGKN